MRRAGETFTFGLFKAWERCLMRFLVEVILAAHVLNESLDAIKLSNVMLNEVPNLKECHILIRTNHCHESMNMGRVVALMFSARYE